MPGAHLQRRRIYSAAPDLISGPHGAGQVTRDCCASIPIEKENRRSALSYRLYCSRLGSPMGLARTATARRRNRNSGHRACERLRREHSRVIMLAEGQRGRAVDDLKALGINSRFVMVGANDRAQSMAARDRDGARALIRDKEAPRSASKRRSCVKRITGLRSMACSGVAVIARVAIRITRERQAAVGSRSRCLRIVVCERRQPDELLCAGAARAFLQRAEDARMAALKRFPAGDPLPTARCDGHPYCRRPGEKAQA